MIKQENGKYVVYSESGRKFGTYETEAKAKRRLAQMEMFKHMKKTASEPKMKDFFAPEPACIVHGAGKKCVTGRGPSFSKKAEIVFEKIAQHATAKGAKKIYDYLTKRLVKNYAKHGHNGGLKGFFNDDEKQTILLNLSQPVS